MDGNGSAGRQPSDRGGRPAAGNQLLQAAQGAEKAAEARRSAPAGCEQAGPGAPGPWPPRERTIDVWQQFSGHGRAGGSARDCQPAGSQAIPAPTITLSHAPGSPCAGLYGLQMDRAQAQGGWNGWGRGSETRLKWRSGRMLGTLRGKRHPRPRDRRRAGARYEESERAIGRSSRLNARGRRRATRRCRLGPRWPGSTFLRRALSSGTLLPTHSRRHPPSRAAFHIPLLQAAVAAPSGARPPGRALKSLPLLLAAPLPPAAAAGRPPAAAAPPAPPHAAAPCPARLCSLPAPQVGLGCTPADRTTVVPPPPAAP